MNIKHAPDTSQSAPSQAARAFLVTGLGSGLFRVIVAAAALLELFSFGVAFVGPYPAAAARIRHATDSIGLPDAWGFIAVMAALTIAAQVSASGNQYRNDFVARKRAPRFTSLAATTGGVALVGWVIFFARFRVAEPGPLALITIATGGIVFFAADAATVLLRSDMRNLLQRQRSSRLRRNVRVVRHELKAARSNACGTLVLCATRVVRDCLCGVGVFLLRR